MDELYQQLLKKLDNLEKRVKTLEDRLISSESIYKTPSPSPYDPVGVRRLIEKNVRNKR